MTRFNSALQHHWMPFTAMRDFIDDPRILHSAEGMYYTSSDGRRILDGAAGLWCVNAGHQHPHVVARIIDGLQRLDYAPGFNFTHTGCIDLAGRLAAMFPQGLDRFFFCNSGSEAVDSALKIALAYHRANGESKRTRFVGRDRSYHGVGFGGMSVGGLPAVCKGWGPLLEGAQHMRHTHDPVRNGFARGEVEHGAELADDLLKIILEYGAETIAAVIVEPVAGSTGVLPPPKGYLARLRNIASEHGILLIFDEVITAFGRLGATTAAERFGVTPDLLTFAKGLTSGVIPMGGVAISRFIQDRVMDVANAPIELPHGYTYSGHPVATAAALGALEAYEQDDLFQRARDLETGFGDACHSLKGSRHVADIRTIGLAGAIELMSRADAPGQRGTAVLKRAWHKGLLVRVTGDTVVLSPPLIVTTGQIGEMVATLRSIFEDVD